MLNIARTGRGKLRKQNTYQLCPHPFFTFAKYREALQEYTQEKVQAYVEQASVDKNGIINPPFTDLLNSLRDSILAKQQKLFPRHKVVVHGIVGTTGENEPTINFATQTFMAPNCGDDFFGVSYKSPVCYAAVMVAGLCPD